MKFDIDARAGAATTLPRERARALPKNPERMAWVVVWGAFSVCMLMTVLLPLAARQFILYALEQRPSTLQAVSLTETSCGTVSLTAPNAAQPSAVTCNPTSFSEGSTIATDATSRAFVTFFDGSTAQVFPTSRLTMKQLRQPRFQWSELPNMIEIDQVRGVVRYGAALALAHPGNPQGRPVHFLVHTPNFDATLSQGSYSVEVNDNASQVVVREGVALVTKPEGGRSIAVEQGQRLQVLKGEGLSEPLPAAQNLVRDGNFSANLKCPPDDLATWRCFFDQGGDGGTVDGTIAIATMGDRRALRISRTGAGTNSAVTGVRQVIDRDVSDFRSLSFSADIWLHYQSLGGGGYQSSEYPLLVRLRYRDVNGNEEDAVRGFYYQNDDQNPTRNGERVPQDQWVPFETGNLLEGLEPKPRPFHLLYLEIYASGWDYESYISGIRLTAE